MGAYFEDRGLLWNLNAAATPKPADVAHHASRASELARVQIEMGGRTKITPALTRLLRERVFAKHPEVALRVYFAKALDLAFLEDLPMLENLSLEVSGRIDSAASLRALRKLRTLQLSLPSVVAPDVLAGLAPTLESLSVGPDDAKHADVDLTPIAALPKLRTLMLRDFGTDLSRVVLPRLTKLRRLVLRSIKNMKSLDPIGGLTELRSVTLQRGAFEAIDVLAKLPHLRYLQLWNLSKVASIEPIAAMTSIEGLFLETMNNAKAFPETRKLTRLVVVKLAAMKSLRDFGTLERAPKLEEFVIQRAEMQRPEDFVPVLRNRTLERGGFGFHKKEDVRRMTELCAAHRVDGEVFMYPNLRGDFDALASAD